MLKERRVDHLKSLKRDRLYTKTIYIYECDGCHTVFERKSPNRRPMHFCTRECYQASARSGVAHDHVISAMTVEVIERKRRTMLERHGVTTFMSLPEVQAKARATCMERYGSLSSMGDPNVRAKKEATFLAKYGTTVPIAYNVGVYERASRKLSHVKSMVHWKTGATLLCRAFYEIAFVNWCNTQQIDFDWQIPFQTTLLTKRGRQATYIIDAFIKDGDHANTYVEIKGYMRPNSRRKWEWFKSYHPNAELWDKLKLQENGVL